MKSEPSNKITHLEKKKSKTCLAAKADSKFFHNDY